MLRARARVPSLTMQLSPRMSPPLPHAPMLAAFGPPLRAEADELKRFLHQHLYRHYQVMRMTAKARRIVADLFAAFLDEPRLLPPDHQSRAASDKPRAIADYVAGMTDRYAIKEHRRLFAIGEI